MNKKTKERLETREFEETKYFVYFTGETEYDEIHGEPTRSEVREVLDENFNMLVLDSEKKNAESWVKNLKNNEFYANRELFIGEQSIEKRLYDPCDDIEYYAPLKRPNTVGIWMKPTDEEKAKYAKLLEAQSLKNKKVIKLQ